MSFIRKTETFDSDKWTVCQMLLRYMGQGVSEKVKHQSWESPVQ